MCTHLPPCPAAMASDRVAARTMASYPEQGWSLLCNGVVLFDDAGELLPGGQEIQPRPVVPAQAVSTPAVRALLAAITFGIRHSAG